MYKKEGVRGLFRGNFVNCSAGVPFNAFEFFFYELAKNNLFPGLEKKDLEFKHKFVCGGFAGWGAQILINPLSVIKTVFMIDQNHNHKSRSIVIDKTVEVYRTNGIPGFYKGLSVSMMGIFPYIALRQSTFDYLKNTAGPTYFPQYCLSQSQQQ